MVEKPSGRHSAGNELAFYRSAALWFLPWFLVAVVALTAVWIAVDALGNETAGPLERSSDKAAAAGDPSPSPSPTPTPEMSPTPTPETSPTPSSSPSPKPAEDKGDAELITDGVTVQVLNSTSDQGAEDALVKKLEDWGFEIFAVNPYLVQEKSVVYWSSQDSKAAAEALADRLGWDAAAKPADLSSEVSVHLLVGNDAL